MEAEENDLNLDLMPLNIEETLNFISLGYNNHHAMVTSSPRNSHQPDTILI